MRCRGRYHLNGSAAIRSYFSGCFLSGDSGPSATGAAGFQTPPVVCPLPCFSHPIGPQVDRDYDGALCEKGVLPSASGCKRKLEDRCSEERAARAAAAAARQRAWLRRRSSGASAPTWRPKNIFRRAAYRWCMQVDNQLKLHTTFAGFSAFVLPAPERLREGGVQGVLSAPQLTVVSSRGSDGVASLHFLQRRMRCNIEPVFDGSHDSWRDFQRALRENCRLPFWCVFQITANMVQGPFLENSRFNAMQQAMQAFGSRFSPWSCPLFSELANQMLWEADVTHQQGDAAASQEEWDALQSDPIFYRRGYKVNMNRFRHGPEVAAIYAIISRSFASPTPSWRRKRTT